MAGYRSVPVIVRRADIMAWDVPSHLVQAVRDGRARFVGFDPSQGDPAALLARRLSTMAPTASRPLSEMPVRMVAADEVDADAWAARGGRGVGVTGPSRRGA